MVPIKIGESVTLVPTARINKQEANPVTFLETLRLLPTFAGVLCNFESNCKELLFTNVNKSK